MFVDNESRLDTPCARASGKKDSVDRLLQSACREIHRISARPMCRAPLRKSYFSGSHQADNVTRGDLPHAKSEGWTRQTPCRDLRGTPEAGNVCGLSVCFMHDSRRLASYMSETLFDPRCEIGCFSPPDDFNQPKRYFRVMG